MTIGKVYDGNEYRMDEDDGQWLWRKEWIEGLAEKEPTNAEILKLAINTYGRKKQIAVCIEEMSELTKAFIKLYREEKTNVEEEIADVKIMLQQMSMIFDEKEIVKTQEEKMRRLYNDLKEEQEVEVVYGRHKLDGKLYTWINPDKHPVEIGGIATADTKHGEQPIIVAGISTGELKCVKAYRHITGGVK